MDDDTVVFGASGFLGQHLLAAAAAAGMRPRVVTRRPAAAAWLANADWRRGDLADPSSLRGLLRADDTVVNLAYSPDATMDENLAAADHLLAVCRQAGVRRLVHCSTAMVAGATVAPRVDETVACRPKTPYERSKWAIEERIVAAAGPGLSVAILRPTAIVGPGGANLAKLASDLLRGATIANYCRRSLFGTRPMHLVPVSTVAAALLHLACLPEPGPAETFIVAADDDADNSFPAVERILRAALGLPAARVPALPVPRVLLSLALRLRGRSDAAHDRFYSCDKLRRTGFAATPTVAEAVRDFGTWFRTSRA